MHIDIIDRSIVTVRHAPYAPMKNYLLFCTARYVTEFVGIVKSVPCKVTLKLASEKFKRL